MNTHAGGVVTFLLITLSIAQAACRPRNYYIMRHLERYDRGPTGIDDATLTLDGFEHSQHLRDFFFDEGIVLGAILTTLG